MKIERFKFGEIEGAAVQGFALRSSNGLSAKLIGYGARLTECHAPGRDARWPISCSVLTTSPSYIANNAYFGAPAGASRPSSSAQGCPSPFHAALA